MSSFHGSGSPARSDVHQSDVRDIRTGIIIGPACIETIFQPKNTRVPSMRDPNMKTHASSFLIEKVACRCIHSAGDSSRKAVDEIHFF
jgi:hypothetical protein